MAIPAQDRQTLSQFVDWSLGQGSVAKYNDGQFLGECVSLINQYCWRVLDVPADAWGDAKDWATNANVAKYFDKVSDLQAGDILVYGANFGGGFGHIEIYLGGGLVIGQNRDFKRKVGKYSTLAGYTTILRKKGNKGMTKEQIQIIYGFAAVGDPAPENHISAWVGKSVDQYLTMMNTDPSIKARQKAARTALDAGTAQYEVVAEVGGKPSLYRKKA